MSDAPVPSSPLTFYWGSGSPFAWRAMLALELKGLSYRSERLEFSKGEHRSPQMLALNPRGKVPVLVDGDLAVYESLAIVAYLDRRFPESPLLGRDPSQAAKIWQLVFEHESYLAGVALRVIRPLFMDQAEQNAGDVRNALDEVHGELARLESRLADGPWLVDSAPSAADIVFWVTLQQLRRASTKPAAELLELGLATLDDRYTRIAAWNSRFEALPRVENTWPPHWST